MNIVRGGRIISARLRSEPLCVIFAREENLLCVLPRDNFESWTWTFHHKASNTSPASSLGGCSLPKKQLWKLQLRHFEKRPTQFRLFLTSICSSSKKASLQRELAAYAN
jgi:hypothetical protein